jgi:NAD(P)-dependent dehydrogenase (short-subunit alcohol dehydrogenase family)
MELGISGLRALVCGASRGLGFACGAALAAEDAEVTLVARNREPLLWAAAGTAAAAAANVSGIAADVSTPAGRAGTPQEPGTACAFLCSRRAAYITGQNLLIDNGSSEHANRRAQL